MEGEKLEATRLMERWRNIKEIIITYLHLFKGLYD